MKILGVIPARYASTRFPGKPLVDIGGKSMIRRVYEQASKCGSLDKVYVATDDTRIFDHVKNFGGEVLMTLPGHQNGTSRCNEVLEILQVGKRSEQYDVVINIQGDEPFIDPSQIDKIAGLFSRKQTEIATLVKKISDQHELFNHNVVKVVFAQDRAALYFSRQTIPYLRDFDKNDWLKHADFFKHIGIYGYRSEVLRKISKLNTGKIEALEQLEQLRWLENGFQIAVEITDIEGISIDTPEDLSKLTNRT